VIEPAAESQGQPHYLPFWRTVIVATLSIGVLSAACYAKVEAGGVAHDRFLLVQAVGSTNPSILIASTILAEPGKQTPLPIQIEGADPQSQATFLVVLKGLPPEISMTKGYAVAAGIWIVSAKELPGLAVKVPMGVSGRSELIVYVVARDGRTVTEVRPTLLIEPTAATAAPTTAAPTAGPKLEPAPAPLPAAPTLALTPDDRKSAERLVALGERELEQGNIARARLFFLRGAQMGLARGALLLATTYDPSELSRLRVVAVQPDLAEARKWYDRARELGAPEATERLSRLQGR